MKKIRLALLMMVLASISVESYAMLSASEIRHEARFLSDKMRYELGLNVRQFEDVYEINFDFLWNVNEILDDMAYGYDDAIDYYYYLLDLRNEDLSYVLRRAQFKRFMKREYFYRPVYNSGRYLVFRIYEVYRDRAYFHYGLPSIYDSYLGAHYRIHYPHGFYHDRYHFALYVRHDYYVWRPGGYGNNYGDNLIGHGVMSNRVYANHINYENSRRDNAALMGSSVSSRAGSSSASSVSRSGEGGVSRSAAVSEGSASRSGNSSVSSSSSRSGSSASSSSRSGSGSVSRSGSSSSSSRSGNVSSDRSSSSSSSSRSGNASSSSSSSRSGNASSSSSSSRSGNASSSSSSSRSGSSVSSRSAGSSSSNSSSSRSGSSSVSRSSSGSSSSSSASRSGSSSSVSSSSSRSGSASGSSSRSGSSSASRSR